MYRSVTSTATFPANDLPILGGNGRKILNIQETQGVERKQEKLTKTKLVTAIKVNSFDRKLMIGNGEK